MKISDVENIKIGDKIVSKIRLIDDGKIIVHQNQILIIEDILKYRVKGDLLRVDIKFKEHKYIFIFLMDKNIFPYPDYHIKVSHDNFNNLKYLRKKKLEKIKNV